MKIFYYDRGIRFCPAVFLNRVHTVVAPARRRRPSCHRDPTDSCHLPNCDSDTVTVWDQLCYYKYVVACRTKYLHSRAASRPIHSKLYTGYVNVNVNGRICIAHYQKSPNYAQYATVPCEQEPTNQSAIKFLVWAKY